LSSHCSIWGRYDFRRIAIFGAGAPGEYPRRIGDVALGFGRAMRLDLSYFVISCVTVNVSWAPASFSKRSKPGIGAAPRGSAVMEFRSSMAGMPLQVVNVGRSANGALEFYRAIRGRDKHHHD